MDPSVLWSPDTHTYIPDTDADTGAPWVFDGLVMVPANRDTLAPSTTVVLDWADQSGIDALVGFHIDAGDTTQIVFENPGRYSLTITFNIGVIQPTVPMPDGSIFSPVAWLNTQGFQNAHLSAPQGGGGFGDFSSYCQQTTESWITANTVFNLKISVSNDDVNNTLIFLQFRYVTINYLGPAPVGL
jgi:hypothetical protein